MSKDAFLYQINFNRKKYPEICQALEEAKADNGVAWYLRELISKDIAEKKGYYQLRSSGTPEIEKPKTEEKPKPRVYDELPDESGGFL